MIKSKNTLTGGQAAVKSLKKEKVKHVFGLIGSATMEMFDALYHEKKIKFEAYKNAKSESEKRSVPLGEGVTLVRDMFVADTMEEAKEKAGQHMVNYMKWVCHWRGLGNHMDPGEELPETKGKLDLLNYEFLHKRNMLFGTPEYVTDKIKELQSELNLQNLQVWSNFPGVKHEDCMKSIKLFTEKVMPNFKDDLDTKVKKVS